jgi:cytidylate kinase
MQKIILIAGPTGSGKSELALRLAKKINGEIINADSMQVYKEIKILSARPESYFNISHYLYGNISVKSVSHYLHNLHIWPFKNQTSRLQLSNKSEGFTDWLEQLETEPLQEGLFRRNELKSARF